MSNLNIGTKVFIIPNEEERNGAVGIIEGCSRKASWISGDKVNDLSFYRINGKTYARTELAIEKDVLDFIDDEGESFSRIVEAIDTDHETVSFMDIEKPVKANEIYYCDICDGLHIFGIDDGEAVKPNDEDDEFNLGFMIGYLEAVEDANNYMHKNDCLWDKALTSVDGTVSLRHLIENHRDKLTEFYDKVIELKNAEAEQKPELTLDEIREKLGYDFNLVD